MCTIRGQQIHTARPLPKRAVDLNQGRHSRGRKKRVSTCQRLLRCPLILIKSLPAYSLRRLVKCSVGSRTKPQIISNKKAAAVSPHIVQSGRAFALAICVHLMYTPVRTCEVFLILTCDKRFFSPAAHRGHPNPSIVAQAESSPRHTLVHRTQCRRV